MVVIELFMNYLIWHYTLAVRNIFVILGNFIWFFWNFFSIKQLAMTLFVPWKRLREEKPEGFDLFNYFSSITITFIMRIVGALLRGAVIITGILSIIITIILGVAFLVAWIFMPFLLILMLAVGIRLASNKF